MFNILINIMNNELIYIVDGLIDDLVKKNVNNFVYYVIKCKICL